MDSISIHQKTPERTIRSSQEALYILKRQQFAAERLPGYTVVLDFPRRVHDRNWLTIAKMSVHGGRS